MKKVMIALCISAALSQTQNIVAPDTNITTSSNSLGLEEVKDNNLNQSISKTIN